MVQLERQERASLVILRMLHDKGKLSPFQIYAESGLQVIQSRLVLSSLLEDDLVAKTSDGFGSFIHITKKGLALL